MPLLELDPSLGVGLLCQSLASFNELCDACAALGATLLLPFTISEAPPRIPRELGEHFQAGADEEGVCLL